MLPNHLDDSFYDLNIELVNLNVNLIVNALFMYVSSYNYLKKI